MDYQVYISTPKNTPASAPKKTDLELTRGFLKGGWIYFPYGPAGTLHCQLWLADTQIAPANRGASYNIDADTLPLSLDFLFDEPPFILTVLTWNTSTENDHALSLCVFLREFPKIKSLSKGSSPWGPEIPQA